MSAAICPTIPGLIACLMFAPAQASEVDVESQFLQINYRFEVAGYCGLVNEQVARGFHVERKQLLAQQAISEEEQQALRGKAWQMAHKEWLNRGLGGFKRWCRNEGQEYAQNFVSLSER
jgi:hypothetical protein